MASVINTNIASLNAQRNLLKSQNDMQTAMQRLSSGLRINSAKDDAAGLAISDRMSAQINGLNQATRNANDAMSIAQVAEGALGEVTNALQRIRVLAVQSANDTNTATDRASLQKEVEQLKQEITRLATQTSFNGKNLLDGSFMNQVFHVGAYADQSISFSIGSTKASDIGANMAVSDDRVGTTSVLEAKSKANIGNPTPGGADNGVTANTLTIVSDLTGSTGKAITISAGASAKDIVGAVNNASAQTGVIASARTEVVLSGLSGADASGGGADTISFKLNNVDINVGDGVAAVTLEQIATAINNASGSTGVTATYSSDGGGKITLVAEDGSDIKITGFKDNNESGGTADASINVVDTNGVSIGTINQTNNSIAVGGQVTFDSRNAFTVTDGGTGVMTVASTPATETGSPAASVMLGNGVAAQTLTVDGPTGSANVSVDANMSAYEIAQRVNQQTATTGVSATARTEAKLSDLSAAGTIEFKLAGRPGQDPVTISAQVDNKDNLTALAKAINEKTSVTGITANLSDDLKSITLVSADGYDIKLADFQNKTVAGAQTVTLDGTTLTEGAADSLTVAGQVSFSAPGAFTVTSDNTNSTVVTGTVRSELSAVGSIDIGTQKGANEAIKVVDGALAYVDDLRADLGAIQNRFSSVVSSNSVTSENVAAARSRVQDADFAAETANLSRAQILQQAGTAMLAQANASTQNVLTFLR